MTYSSDETGEACLKLTAEEHKLLKAGKPVKKIVMSVNGSGNITIKLTYPRDKAKRFPWNIYGEDYKPPA